MEPDETIMTSIRKLILKNRQEYQDKYGLKIGNTYIGMKLNPVGRVVAYIRNIDLKLQQEVPPHIRDIRNVGDVMYHVDRFGWGMYEVFNVFINNRLWSLFQ